MSGGDWIIWSQQLVLRHAYTSWTAAYREGLFVNSAWAVGCLHCHMQRASWADRSRIGVRILPKISKQIYQENHELAL